MLTNLLVYGGFALHVRILTLSYLEAEEHGAVSVGKPLHLREDNRRFLASPVAQLPCRRGNGGHYSCDAAARPHIHGYPLPAGR